MHTHTYIHGNGGWHTAHIHEGSWHETCHRALTPQETQLYSLYNCEYCDVPSMGRDSSTTVQCGHTNQPSCLSAPDFDTEMPSLFLFFCARDGYRSRVPRAYRGAVRYSFVFLTGLSLNISRWPQPVTVCIQPLAALLVHGPTSASRHFKAACACECGERPALIVHVVRHVQSSSVTAAASPRRAAASPRRG